MYIFCFIHYSHKYYYLFIYLQQVQKHIDCYIKNDLEDVTRLFGISQNPDTGNYLIVTDYRGTTLRTYLDREIANAKWQERIEILYGISSGLDRIHKSGLIHG